MINDSLYYCNNHDKWQLTVEVRPQWVIQTLRLYITGCVYAYITGITMLPGLYRRLGDPGHFRERPEMYIKVFKSFKN